MGGASGVGAKAGLAVQLMGAAMSVALLAGGGIWGYKLIVRDATGVPVVRAMGGPMREAPSDPGGVVALHTGLSVNTIAGQGEAAPPEDVFLLAPPTPDLTDEDLLVQSTAEADEFHLEAPVAATTDPVITGSETPVVAATPVAPITIAPSDEPMSTEDILALADSISAGTTPLSELEDAPITSTDVNTETSTETSTDTDAETANAVLPVADQATDDASEQAAPPTTEIATDSAVIAQEQAAALAIANAVADAAETPASETAPDIAAEADTQIVLAALDADGRPLRSLRPSGRPEGLASGTTTPGITDTPEQSFAVSTEDVPLGTTLVQLGAFDSADLAGAEWLRLSGRFDAFMAGKDNLIQEATSGGRSFYRLRATGFVDIADARRFCSALVSEGAACIPVVVQ